MWSFSDCWSFIDIQAVQKIVAHEINLVSNNFGTINSHFMVVFVDMALDLGVLVEHRYSHFEF